MRKIIGALILGVGVLYVTTMPTAGYAREVKPLYCFSTYDYGTTNFYTCSNCAEQTGSNLQDRSTCSPD